MKSQAYLVTFYTNDEVCESIEYINKAGAYAFDSRVTLVTHCQAPANRSPPEEDHPQFDDFIFSFNRDGGVTMSPSASTPSILKAGYLAAGLLHHRCGALAKHVDGKQVPELEASFRQHGFDYSRGLDQCCDVCQQLFLEMDFLNKQHDRRTLVENCVVGIVEGRHRITSLARSEECEDLTVQWANGKFWWAIFRRALTRGLPRAKQSLSAATASRVLPFAARVLWILILISRSCTLQVVRDET